MSVVNVGQIVISDKFKHSDEDFNYYIGYQGSEIVKALPYVLFYLIWVDTSNALKTVAKIGLFWLKMMKCKKYTKKIWDMSKNKVSITFHSQPIYDHKYLKAKVGEFDGVIKTNFLDNDTPKENMHYTCTACITIDSVIRTEKKPSRGLFRGMQI